MTRPFKIIDLYKKKYLIPVNQKIGHKNKTKNKHQIISRRNNSLIFEADRKNFKNPALTIKARMKMKFKTLEVLQVCSKGI